MDFKKEFDETPQKFDLKIWILTTIVVLLPFLSIILLVTMAGSDSTKDQAILKIAEGNINFTKNLYKTVSLKEGNVFISPLSVEVVLALAYMGAKGQTADEIAAALLLPSQKDDTRAGFRSLMDTLKSSENITLEIANKIYSKNDYHILKEFREIAEKDFLSGAEELNFSDGEASRQVINSWVEEKTRNKIRDLIPSGLLNSMTRLVLVNAIYFKGLWKNQFDESNTKPEKFHLNSNEHKMIPMMTKKAHFGYKESDELDATILEMAYQGDKNLSMFVILPTKIDGIKELEEKLSSTDLTKILNRLPSREVIVTMPKFKLEETTDFDNILKEMGMASMYDQKNADFSGISGVSDLFVSKVLQKAFIEVNEKGSEAAAATAGIMMLRSMPRPPTRFTADHPFIFVICNRESSLTLFIGRFSKG